MGWGVQTSTGMMYQMSRRDYVGGDEIDVALGVDGAAFADGVGGAGFVGIGAEGVGAFDLDAEEVDGWLWAVVEDEVVALAVSPGLGDGEAALAGLVEEGGFGTLSGALGVGAGVALGHRELLGDLIWRFSISDSYYSRRSRVFTSVKEQGLAGVKRGVFDALCGTGAAVFHGCGWEFDEK